MGKVGLIVRKVVVMFCSMGVLVLFFYFVEVFYGDLGMFGCDDLLFVILNSGKMEEVLVLFFYVKRIGIFVVLLMGDFNSVFVW